MRHFTTAEALAVQGPDHNVLPERLAAEYILELIDPRCVYADELPDVESLYDPSQIPGLVEAFKCDPASVPPVLVTHNLGASWELADGHHRHAAALLAGTQMWALVPA